MSKRIPLPDWLPQWAKESPHLFKLNWWGFEPKGITGDDVYGTCPFCQEDTLALARTGQWICSRAKHCGRKGNGSTFLEEYWRLRKEETHPNDLRELADWRELPLWVFMKNGWAYDPTTDRYFVPTHSAGGKVTDLRNVRLAPKAKVFSTKGSDEGLLGYRQLVALENGDPVFLMGGEWDKMATQVLLRKLGHPGVAVSFGGEGHFQNAFGKYFEHHPVYLGYDHDEAGFKGLARVGGAKGYPKKSSRRADGLIRLYSRKVFYCNWPEDSPEGYDANDFTRDNGKTAKAANLFLSYFQPNHPLEKKPDVDPASAPAAVNGKHDPPPPAPKVGYEDVEKAFSDFMEMTPEYRDALRCTLATVMTSGLEAEPVWLYLVGPPGGGKTALLLPFSQGTGEEDDDQDDEDDPYSYFVSNMTPHALVSGFMRNPDPSLVPKLNRKCLVMKDFTEILDMNPNQRDEIYAILRGAFDGRVERIFGNGVTRRYKSKFNIVAGVTAKVNSINKSSVGERFMKFKFRDNNLNSNAKVRAALSSMNRDKEKERRLAEVVRGFLDYNVPRLLDRGMPDPDDAMTDRLMNAANLAEFMRTSVDANFQGEVNFNPEVAIGTRLARQLYKLWWGLSHVDGGREVAESQWPIVRRVAMDTATGYPFQVVQAFAELEFPRSGFSFEEISALANIPKSTCRRVVENMETVGLLQRTKEGEQDRRGPRRYLFSPIKHVQNLWNQVHEEER